MGFWNHLGKAALVAAPYIAAPFTGGTSLLLTGAANAAEQRWAQHDAEKAIAEGREPSHFDRWLGLGANVAGIASGVGALGSLGGAAGGIASTIGSAANTGTRIANIANTASGAIGAVGQGQQIHNANKGLGPTQTPAWMDVAQAGLGATGAIVGAASAPNVAGGPSKAQRIMGAATAAAPGIMGAINQSGGGGGGGGSANNQVGQNTGNKSQYLSGIGPSPLSSQVMPMGGYSYNQNPMNQVNQNNPNLAQSIFQGRQEAIRNQPFRAGYDVNTLGNDDKTPVTQRMPPIVDSNQGYNPENDVAIKTKQQSYDVPKKSQSSNTRSGRNVSRR